MADPLLQKFIALKKDDAVSKRVVHWIEAVLEDVLNGNADDKLFKETMEILEEYVSRVKVRVYIGNPVLALSDLSRKRHLSS